MANPNIKDHAHKGGRPKGSKDKIPRDLKDRVLAVWDELAQEGKDLSDCAKADPPWFYANFVKPMLPKNVELTGENGGPVDMSLTVKFVNPDGC